MSWAGIRVTPLADQIVIEPLLGDALQLSEEVQLWLFAGISPLGVKEPLVQT
jgi:hypothetical protein